MRRRSGRLVTRFVNGYPARLPILKRFATEAERRVADILQPLNLELHQVVARAKTASSAIAKIRRKGYGNPWRQLTDQVGVRVIVYYEKDVDRAAAAIAAGFEIDAERSVDKRRDLQIRQFGYRSVHLLARFHSGLPESIPPQLQRMWFEIQVRSILEHAWAEIEHEVCYKSGIVFPETLLRRFGAMAGALEILDSQFTTLRHEREQLLERLRERYSLGHDLDVALDAARLAAAFAVFRPDGVGWIRRQGVDGRLPTGSDAACADALRAAGIKTARLLNAALSGRRCKRRIAAFASANGIEPNRVSHFALSVIVTGLAKESLLARFPDLIEDPLLRALFPDLGAA